jgi:3-phenylpropionate/trans-cinnamate dioxygenase ferredoxin reductase subunit
MLVVKADLDVCMGYASCVMAAEDYFDLNEEAGVVTLHRTVVRDGDRERVEEAVRACPVQALVLESS